MTVHVGQPVHYHPIIGEAHDGKTYTVREIGDLSGRPVAWLDGKSGCVSLDALTPAAPAEHEFLTAIDMKCSAGLTSMTFTSAREFFRDIRKLVADRRALAGKS